MPHLSFLLFLLSRGALRCISKHELETTTKVRAEASITRIHSPSCYRYTQTCCSLQFACRRTLASLPFWCLLYHTQRLKLFTHLASLCRRRKAAAQQCNQQHGGCTLPGALGKHCGGLRKQKFPHRTENLPLKVNFFLYHDAFLHETPGHSSHTPKNPCPKSFRHPELNHQTKHRSQPASQLPSSADQITAQLRLHPSNATRALSAHASTPQPSRPPRPILPPPSRSSQRSPAPSIQAAARRPIRAAPPPALPAARRRRPCPAPALRAHWLQRDRQSVLPIGNQGGPPRSDEEGRASLLPLSVREVRCTAV